MMLIMSFVRNDSSTLALSATTLGCILIMGMGFVAAATIMHLRRRQSVCQHFEKRLRLKSDDTTSEIC